MGILFPCDVSIRSFSSLFQSQIQHYWGNFINSRQRPSLLTDCELETCFNFSSRRSELLQSFSGNFCSLQRRKRLRRRQWCQQESKNIPTCEVRELWSTSSVIANIHESLVLPLWEPWVRELSRKILIKIQEPRNGIFMTILSIFHENEIEFLIENILHRNFYCFSEKFQHNLAHSISLLLIFLLAQLDRKPE